MEAMVGLEGVLTSHHAVRKNVNFSEDFSLKMMFKSSTHFTRKCVINMNLAFMINARWLVMPTFTYLQGKNTGEQVAYSLMILKRSVIMFQITQRLVLSF